MMDTILNLGMNDEVGRDRGREERQSSVLPGDSYRRFLQMYGDVVMGVQKAGRGGPRAFSKTVH